MAWPWEIGRRSFQQQSKKRNDNLSAQQKMSKSVVMHLYKECVNKGTEAINLSTGKSKRQWRLICVILFTDVFKTVTVLSIAHGQIRCGNVTWPRTQTNFRTVILSG